LRILIDTHYLLWSAIDPDRMEPWARKLIEDFDNEILVSAASLYEIGLKVRCGKLPDAVEFESDLILNMDLRFSRWIRSRCYVQRDSRTHMETHLIA